MNSPSYPPPSISWRRLAEILGGSLMAGLAVGLCWSYLGEFGASLAGLAQILAYGLWPVFVIWVLVALCILALGPCRKFGFDRSRCASFAMPNLALAIFLGTGLGSYILKDQWEIETAESYVSRALPILEQIKTQSNQYPLSLSETNLGRPPRLMRKLPDHYSSDGQTFTFRYADTSWAMTSSHSFSSTERKWRHPLWGD